MKGAKRATKTKKRRIAKAVVPRGSLKRILKFDHTCPKNVTSVLSRFSIQNPVSGSSKVDSLVGEESPTLPYLPLIL